MRYKAKRWLLGSLPFIFLITLWFFIVHFNIIKPFFLPSPAQVVASTYDLFVRYKFMKDTLVSLARILAGFLAACIIAIPLGIVMGQSRKVTDFIEPLIAFVRYTPLPAFIPLFILWFGIGELEKFIVIFCSVFFQVVLMIANSSSEVPEDIISFAKILGVSKKRVLTTIVFSYMKPRILDDMRVAMGFAWSGVILAEIVGATTGIGATIIHAQRLLQTPILITSIIIVGILGLMTDYVFKLFNRKLYPWAGKNGQ